MALLTPHDPCFLARGGNPPPLDGPTTAGKPYWPAGLAISWSAGKMRAKVSGEKVLWHLIGLLKNFELEGGGWVIDILHDMHAAEPGSLPVVKRFFTQSKASAWLEGMWRSKEVPTRDVLARPADS